MKRAKRPPLREIAAAQKPSREQTRGPRFSLDNPPTGYTMTVAELAELVGMGRSQAYAAVNSGIYPCIHTGKKGSTFRILTAPTLEILRGERPPGPLRRPRNGNTRRR